MARGIAIALALSIAINMFLGGIVVGKWFAQTRQSEISIPANGSSKDENPRFGRHPNGEGAFIREGDRPRRGRPPRHGDILSETISLSPEARAAVRDATRGRRSAIRQRRAETRRLKSDIRSALTADPFDRQSAENALNALIEFRSTFAGERMSLMLDVFENLPKEERRRLTQMQSEQSSKRRNRQRHTPRPGGPPDGPPEGALAQ